MNNFTISEAKDALMDEVETRKFIYRQLTSNVQR